MLPSWNARARPATRTRSGHRGPGQGRVQGPMVPHPSRGRTWCPTPPSGRCWRWRWAAWEAPQRRRAPGRRWSSGCATSRWSAASLPLRRGQEVRGRAVRGWDGEVGLTDWRAVLEDVVDRKSLLPEGPALHDAATLIGRAQQNLQPEQPSERGRFRPGRPRPAPPGGAHLLRVLPG